MKSLYCIICLFVSLNVFCQADTVFIRHRDYSYKADSTDPYKTDTLIFQSVLPGQHILYGTTILPGSYSQESLSLEGMPLVAVSGTNCIGHEPFTNGNEIESIIKTDSTLDIETKIIANCGYSFLCDIKIENNAILNLIYYVYGSYADCDCCFGLTYKFVLVKKEFRLDDLKKLKFVMINGDKKTMKPLGLNPGEE